MKKLYLSRTDKKLFGVCGGIADYFSIDSTVVRLAFAIAVVCGGVGVIAYILAALIIPEKPKL